jgi:hypothetical protein
MRDELSKSDIGRIAPNATALFLGISGYGLTVAMQENFYNKPNNWADTVAKIENVIGIRPDFMTSFMAPLILIQAL